MVYLIETDRNLKVVFSNSAVSMLWVCAIINAGAAIIMLMLGSLLSIYDL